MKACRQVNWIRCGSIVKLKCNDGKYREFPSLSGPRAVKLSTVRGAERILFNSFDYRNTADRAGHMYVEETAQGVDLINLVKHEGL